MRISDWSSDVCSSDLHRSHRLAPLVIGHPHDKRILDRRMGLERFLDLFGIDLFARGVDADAAPAEQGQAAIGLDRAPVSGNRIADTADGLESSRRFFRILVIFEREDRKSVV